MQKNRNLFLNSRDIHNTCIMYMYLLDAPFLQIIEHQALKNGTKSWLLQYKWIFDRIRLNAKVLFMMETNVKDP